MMIEERSRQGQRRATLLPFAVPDISQLEIDAVLEVLRSGWLTTGPAVEQALSPRTRALIGVDVAGQPCDWQRLRGLAESHKFLLVDDAAHALPSTLGGRSVGSWADLTAFSFYATKTLTTGEGGMLVTDCAAWAERAASMALHGISKDAWKRYTADGSWYYEVIAPGFKYNMTDIAAALGLVQLGRLEEMYQRRVAIAASTPSPSPTCRRSSRQPSVPTERQHGTSTSCGCI